MTINLFDIVVQYNTMSFHWLIHTLVNMLTASIQLYLEWRI